MPSEASRIKTNHERARKLAEKIARPPRVTTFAFCPLRGPASILIHHFDKDGIKTMTLRVRTSLDQTIGALGSRSIANIGTMADRVDEAYRARRNAEDALRRAERQIESLEADLAKLKESRDRIRKELSAE